MKEHFKQDNKAGKVQRTTTGSIPWHCVTCAKEVERRWEIQYYWEMHYYWPHHRQSPAKWDLWKTCSVSVLITGGGNQTFQWAGPQAHKQHLGTPADSRVWRSEALREICPLTSRNRSCPGVQQGYSRAWKYVLVLPHSLSVNCAPSQREPGICNDSSENKNNNDGKKPPWKAKPRLFPIITNYIGCSLPEIPWAISKQNAPEVPLCPSLLVVVLAATSQPAVCHPAASKPQLFLFIFFPDEVHGSQCFTTCMLGKKKSKREKISIYSVFIFSENMLQSGELWCVCIVWERTLSSTAAGKINGILGLSSVTNFHLLSYSSFVGNDTLDCNSFVNPRKGRSLLLHQDCRTWSIKIWASAGGCGTVWFAFQFLDHHNL